MIFSIILNCFPLCSLVFCFFSSTKRIFYIFCRRFGPALCYFLSALWNFHSDERPSSAHSQISVKEAEASVDNTEKVMIDWFWSVHQFIWNYCIHHYMQGLTNRFSNDLPDLEVHLSVIRLCTKSLPPPMKALGRALGNGICHPLYLYAIHRGFSKIYNWITQKQ